MAMRALADELESPKYSHVERERRWLVDRAARPPLDRLAYVTIDDCYIRGSRLRLRRMTDPASGATSLKLTKKYDCADRLARPIVTSYLSEAEQALLSELPPIRWPSGAINWSRRRRVEPRPVRWAARGLELLESERPMALSSPRCGRRLGRSRVVRPASMAARSRARSSEEAPWRHPIVEARFSRPQRHAAGRARAAIEAAGQA